MEENNQNKKNIIINEPYKDVFGSDKRYILLAGGRAGGRSYFASQYALMKLKSPEYFRCGIMRYVLGDIRNSIFQEIIDRLEEFDIEKTVEIRDGLLSIKNNKNSIKGIGFRKSSSDQKAKLKSLAGFTTIIIEEAEEINEEDFNQLDESLRKLDADIKIILLFNLPPKDHWINKKWFNLKKSEVDGFYLPELRESMISNTCYVHTDYKDNEKHLNKSSIDLYENYKETNPDHYWNMIKGLVPTGKKGLIFKNWEIVNDKEFDALPYTSFYGLDFGFSNDPTALVEIKTHNENVWIRELIYSTGLTNQDISVQLKNLGVSKEAYIYADSAEPKSIEEIRKEEWNIHPCIKGAGSINAGISKLLEKKIFYTENSENLIREKENYCWALDRNKEPTNNPIDDYNHLMDAIRYGLYTNLNKKNVGFY